MAGPFFRSRCAVAASGAGLLALLLLAGTQGAAAAQATPTLRHRAPARPRPSAQEGVESGTPGSGNCTTLWFEQTSDHFAWTNRSGVPATFLQRYFVYDKWWNPASGAIWFYTGNEANVELYVNATGLMWEHAQKAGAALVFAEHRFYGETVIYPGDQTKLTTEQLELLTMEQALADYAVLIDYLKETKYNGAPAVGFGGSYGGMVAAWLRMKYPASIVGAISASAPILAFGAAWDSNRYWQVVTRDATPAAGAVAGCDAAVRESWPKIFDMGKTAAGRASLESIFHICPSTPLSDQDRVTALAFMLLNLWDTLAMGNFPFASDYLVFQQTGNSKFTLPPFPFRKSCELMMGKGERPAGRAAGADADVLTRFAAAAGVLYNVTKTEPCFALPGDPNYDGIWDWQWCTELLPQETYFSLDGVKDMFWKRPENMSAIIQHCVDKYGIAPRQEWIKQEFGGAAGIAAASNIVFSNGLFDPWSSGGVGVAEASKAATHVASMGVNGSVKAVVIPNGAHHLDLMFSHTDDPADVKAARVLELEQIALWTAQ